MHKTSRESRSVVPLRLVAARDRHRLATRGMVVVKSGVETRDLRQIWETMVKRLDQLDLLRQCSGSKGLSRCSSSTISAVIRCGLLYSVRHAPRDAPPRPWHPARCVARSNPSGRPPPPVIRRRHRPREIVRLVRALHRKVASGIPIRSIAPRTAGASPGLEQRELDARRAAVDRQDAWVSGFMDDSFGYFKTKRSHFPA